VIAGSFASDLTSAHLTDGIGRKGSLVLFAVGSFIAIAIDTLFPLTNRATLLLGFPPRLFPRRVLQSDGNFRHPDFPGN
jgi:hypothetical protein